MQENKISSSNKYTQMQSKYYEEAASTGDGVDVDNVVGSFQGHNQWKDYKYLFSRLKNVNFKDLKVLDFGCGPGRNIVKYKDIFKQIDGVDISKYNLINEQKYFKNQILDLRNKKARLDFELDQIVASLSVFENSLIHSMKKAADEILDENKQEKKNDKKD